MSAEPRRAPEPLQLWNRAEDRLVVWGGLVEARPRCLHPRTGQRRGAPRRLLDHLLQELPVDLGHKAWRLVTVAHADEDAVALGVKVQGRLEIDGHGRVAWYPGERAGDDDVPPVRQHGDLDAGHAANRCRPRARAVDHEPGRNLAT